MANRDLLLIGTSAGGVEALIFLVSKFPANLPASVFITIHLASEFNSSLDGILSRSGPLPASFATGGGKAEKGQIYIAPPARHLLIEGEKLVLGAGPRENGSRPAIDPMMRSAAVCCGNRSIGVILTGTLGDGASGLWALKHCGGLTIVQDPADAPFSEMPENAMRRSNVDRIVPLADMPPLLQSLVTELAGEPARVPERIKYEVEIAKSGSSNMHAMDRRARRSVFTCPDCHGTMWEINEDELVRYRCHLGHAYNEDVMALALDESLRHSLASGLRALEERVALLRNMHDRATRDGRFELARSWSLKIREFEREAEDVRESIRRLDVIARSARANDPRGNDPRGNDLGPV